MPNILGVFNLDMIGYNPIDKPLKIFYNDRPPINKEFATYFSEISNLYLPNIPALPNQAKDTNRWKQAMGDCFSFVYFDYPAMYMGSPVARVDWHPSDKYYNPCYHTPCDTIGIGKENAGVNSMELVRAYTQATLVAIAELAELSDGYIKETTITNLQIAPNPTDATATLSFDLQTAGILHITLVDLLGNELFEIHNKFTQDGIFSKEFSFAALPMGVYYLKVQLNGNIIVAVAKIIMN